MSMGFNQRLAARALSACNGSMEDAVALLLDPNEIQNLQSQLSPSKNLEIVNRADSLSGTVPCVSERVSEGGSE